MKTFPPRALISPLNWGLGHATRCIPVIRELISQGYEVTVGANGAAATLLRQEFPLVSHLTTPGVTIRYAKRRKAFSLSILSLLPTLFKQLYEEKKWIQKIAEELKPNLIISDNCYGLYHPAIPSVLITHQLNIITGLGKLFDSLLQRLHYSLLKKFDEVWVPDWEGNISFGGALSHPLIMPTIPVFYIGPLNRFSALTTKKDSIEPLIPKKERNPDLLILLSGPEPQRSLLESILKKQVPEIKKRICLLRGLPNKDSCNESRRHTSLFWNQQLPLVYGDSDIHIIDHLPANQLQEIIEKTEIILCRSGYTSLMELLPLHKKLILVPTPGQPEQNYLANYCKENEFSLTVNQEELQLSTLLEKATTFPYKPLLPPANTKPKLMQDRLQYYSRSL